MKKAILNWSGGKDSAWCLHQLRQQHEYDAIALLTTVNQALDRISMHGVRTELLRQQARAVGLPLVPVGLPATVSMAAYDEIMETAFSQLRQQGFTHAVFGDIFLEDLKQYRLQQLERVKLHGVFPLWGQPTRPLAESFINAGFRAILVCVNEKYLDASFAGRLLDHQLLNDLPAAVDPCGENGEYHSFVFDSPGFAQPVAFEKGEVTRRTFAPATPSTSEPDRVAWDTGFYYCDLLPVSSGI